MARLVLSLDGQVLAEYNMTKERYTIGRLPDNDIRVDNPAVSGHHSLVLNILDDSFLEDLNSTNGTYANGKLVRKHALQHGDVVTIGRHQLRYVDEGAESGAEDEFEKTMVIKPGSQPGVPSMDRVQQALLAAGAAPSEPMTGQRNTPAHLPPPLPPQRGEGNVTRPSAASSDFSATATSVGSNSARPATRYGVGTAASAAPAIEQMLPPAKMVLPKAKIQVLSGAFAGKELELTKALTTLGRPGVQVAAITRRAEGYFIVHVDGGADGTFPRVNGQAITQQARPLHDNDVIELAGVKMGFFDI